MQGTQRSGQGEKTTENTGKRQIKLKARKARTTYPNAHL